MPGGYTEESGQGLGIGVAGRAMKAKHFKNDFFKSQKDCCYVVHVLP